MRKLLPALLLCMAGCATNTVSSSGIKVTNHIVKSDSVVKEAFIKITDTNNQWTLYFDLKNHEDCTRLKSVINANIDSIDKEFTTSERSVTK